jgi:hypothetical protein
MIITQSLYIRRKSSIIGSTIRQMVEETVGASVGRLVILIRPTGVPRMTGVRGCRVQPETPWGPNLCKPDISPDPAAPNKPLNARMSFSGMAFASS